MQRSQVEASWQLEFSALSSKNERLSSQNPDVPNPFLVYVSFPSEFADFVLAGLRVFKALGSGNP